MTLSALFPSLGGLSAGELYRVLSVQEGKPLRWEERGFLVSLLSGAGSAWESAYGFVLFGMLELWGCGEMKRRSLGNLQPSSGWCDVRYRCRRALFALRQKKMPRTRTKDAVMVSAIESENGNIGAPSMTPTP